jgi:hypothetical protein
MEDQGRWASGGKQAMQISIHYATVYEHCAAFLFLMQNKLK